MCSEVVQKPSEDIVQVYYLEPAELMIVEIEIDGGSKRALIDSGASTSIVKNSVAGKYRQVLEGPRQVIGLNERRIEVMGRARVPISLGGMRFEVDCLTVDDGSLDYDAVIGVDFLTQNEFSINMLKKEIFIRAYDVRVKLDNTGKVCNVVKERSGVEIYRCRGKRLNRKKYIYI